MVSRAARSRTCCGYASVLNQRVLVLPRRTGCGIDSHAHVAVASARQDKTIVLFGLPGAFTGVCSQYHVPSYTDNHDAIMVCAACS